MENPKAKEITELYNKTCVSLPKVKVLDSDSHRYKHLTKQLKRHPDIRFWELIFQKVETSDFLTGRNGAWSNCAFDWILKPTNLIKIYEGNYDNRKRVMSYKEEQNHYANKRDNEDFVPIKDIFKNNS